MKTLTLTEMEKHIGGDDCATWLSSFAGAFGIASAAIPPLAIGFAILGAAAGVGGAIFCDPGDPGSRTYNPGVPSRGPR